MPIFSPARRWQPAFYPFKKESAGKRILAVTERLIKGPLFGCRMCGNCLLQSTAMICPMECPKGLRNGPCGGVTPEGMCYIDSSRKCVWRCIYTKAEKKGSSGKLLEVLPPVDWDRAGTELWTEVLRKIKSQGALKFLASRFSSNKEKRDEVWNNVFRPIRQPDWWKGDGEYHGPLSTTPVSDLERELRSGRFVFTAEMAPPQSCGTEKMLSVIEQIKPYVTAINFTDASAARPKMSSIACCNIAIGKGAEPVLQISARDTTRVRLQSDIIGINAMGVRNVLCISGDSNRVSQSPLGNMNILDVDSVQMLWILRRMRDEGIYLDGRIIKERPAFFLGAGSSPFALKPELQAVRDQKKINAGAQFIQTNIIFDPDRLDRWLEQLDKRDVLDKVFILAGVAPLKSYKSALYLHNKIPGVYLPEKVLKRMERAGDGEKEEGIAIAVETINALKGRKGISGIHLMTMSWESVIPELVKSSGTYNG
ncbi:MAG TPA: methylenetetrahydrofolate reductase C-terminal domain-containing protein [Bacteroidales bacterium]|nr:methylenetetrahydrofolate reductase C-terminal domain-containing protein [Bacteroidales bacterium]